MTRLSKIRALRRDRRGFTMVELLVAMAAGLAVATAAFVLSKNSSRFFQEESRVSAAQLAATFGMGRLTTDLRRAGFMSSPNIQTDPFRCGDTATYPAGLAELASVRIVKGGSTALHTADLAQSVANGFDPDSIIIGGSFNTTEQFAVSAVVQGNTGGLAIHLQTASGPFQRTKWSAQRGGEDIVDIFKPGRFLRIVDGLGRNEYGVIDSVTEVGPDVTVNLADTVPIPQKTPGADCGYGVGLGTGMLVNPISRVRYELMNLQNDPEHHYDGVTAKVLTNGNDLTGDTLRTELVRTELDEVGDPIAATQELVAEYVVDMKFGVTVATAGGNPTVTRHPIIEPEDDAVYTNAGDVTDNGTPQRIRAVQVRLSTRGRMPDRIADLGASARDGRRARFLVSASLPDPQFARIRTLHADIALANQTEVTW